MYTIIVNFMKSEKVWAIEIQNPNGDYSGVRKYSDYKRAQDFMDGLQFAMKAVNIKCLIENGSTD